MRRAGDRQISGNAGEISLFAYDRSDLKQFYAAASEMTNFEPVAQGGWRLAPRTRLVGAVRAGVFGIVCTTTITAGAVTGPATLATMNFTNGATSLACVIFSGFKASSAATDVLQVEYQDAADGVWKPLAPAFDVATAFRSRVAARPPLNPVQATAARLRYIGTVATTLELAAIAPYYDTAGTPIARLRQFSFSETQVYQIVYTSGFADVWRNGVHVGAFTHGFQSAQVREFKYTNSFDTLLLFHRDHVPLRIMRQGDNHEWNWENISFTNPPKVDLGGVYAKRPQVWRLQITWPSAMNITTTSIVLTVDGKRTTEVFIPALASNPNLPDWPAFESAMLSALLALDNIGAGITLQVQGLATLANISLTFSGDQNIGQGFAVSGEAANTTQVAVSAKEVQTPDRGGEDLFSLTRGYASCGVFYENRLITAGFKARGAAALFSPVSDYYDASITLQSADGGILTSMSTDVVERIQDAQTARHLLFFTNDAEYYISNRGLKRTEPVNIVESSRIGTPPHLPTLKNNTRVLFVSKNNILYSAQYSDIDQAYVPQSISMLAPHFVRNVQDLALQKASDELGAPRLFMPLETGEVSVCTVDETQEINAFFRWKTDGAVRSCCVDYQNIIYFLVERMVGGQPQLFFERLEKDLLLDQAVTQTGAPRTQITGLSMFEGASVYALCDDGWMEGPFTVTSGQITLKDAASTVTVGRWTPPVFTTLPRPKRSEGGKVLDKPVRVNAVIVSVIDTSSLAIAANHNPQAAYTAYPVVHYRAGDQAGIPLPRRTDDFILEGLTGYSPDGYVTLTQKNPGWCHVRSLLIEA